MTNKTKGSKQVAMYLSAVLVLFTAVGVKQISSTNSNKQEYENRVEQERETASSSDEEDHQQLELEEVEKRKELARADKLEAEKERWLEEKRIAKLEEERAEEERRKKLAEEEANRKQRLEAERLKRLEKEKTQSKNQVASRGSNYKSDFEITFYTAFCNTGCIGKTASGYDVSSTIYYEGYRIVAAPKSLAFYTKLRIYFSDGTSIDAIVLDRGGDIGAGRLDLLVSSKKEAYELGRQQVKVEILK